MKLPSGLGAALLSVALSSDGDDCSCSSCRTTATTHLQLTGAALQAVQDFEALRAAHKTKVAEMRQEARTASEKMWAIIKRETGVDAAEIDTDYADIGIVVMKVPVVATVSDVEQTDSDQDASAPVPAAA